MKKTITLLSTLFFSLSLMIPSLMWADKMKHMEEGSGKKMMDKSSNGEHKGEMHSKEYKEGKRHMGEGSGKKEMHGKKAEHKRMEEGSGMEKKMGMAAPKKGGS